MTSEFLNMTGQEVGLRRNETIFLPVGSVEQHGPHLPTETDTLIAKSFAKTLAERTNGLQAPEFNYGYRSQVASGGGELFPGTVSLSGNTVTCLIRDIILAFGAHGHLNIVLVNGHFENTYFCIEGMNEALSRQPNLQLFLFNWWELLTTNQLESIFGLDFPGWEAEHAGVVETSLVMHLAPAKVKTDLLEDRVSSLPIPRFTRLPEPTGQVDSSGVLRTAWGSSAKLGEDIFESSIGEMQRVILSALGN